VERFDVSGMIDKYVTVYRSVLDAVTERRSVGTT